MEIKFRLQNDKMTNNNANENAKQTSTPESCMSNGKCSPVMERMETDLGVI